MNFVADAWISNRLTSLIMLTSLQMGNCLRVPEDRASLLSMSSTQYVPVTTSSSNSYSNSTLFDISIPKVRYLFFFSLKHSN